MKAINLKDNMDIPLQLATRLKKVYGEEKILVDDDLEEDDFLEHEACADEAREAGRKGDTEVMPRDGKRAAGARGGRKKKMKAKDMKEHLANLDRFDD